MIDGSESAALDFQPWFRNKEFTADWLSVKLPFWLAPLRPWIDKEAEVLEVGSYEGRSAVAFLEYLPCCRLTAVDIFIDSTVEGRFDRNMAPYGNRVVKIKDRAIPAMEKMLDSQSFDIIYLDTGKTRSVAFANSALAWPLLRVGGILIWDDLIWGGDRADHKRPEHGIRQFYRAFASCMDVLHEGHQLIARKTKDWPL
jgi:predicted O-methyltransferase YrrM